MKITDVDIRGKVELIPRVFEFVAVLAAAALVGEREDGAGCEGELGCGHEWLGSQ